MSKENNSENIDSLREALVVLAVNCMKNYILELKEASDEKDPEKTEFLLQKDAIETISALACVGCREFCEMMKTRLGVDTKSEEMKKRTEMAGKKFSMALAISDAMAKIAEDTSKEGGKEEK